MRPRRAMQAMPPTGVRRDHGDARPRRKQRGDLPFRNYARANDKAMATFQAQEHWEERDFGLHLIEHRG